MNKKVVAFPGFSGQYLRSTYGRIFAFLKPYRGRLVASVVLSVLFAICNMLFMSLIRDVSREMGNKNLAYFNNHMILALILLAARLITQYGQSYLMAIIGNQVITDVRTTLFQHFTRLSLTFHTRQKIGDMMSRLFSDVDRVKQGLIASFDLILPQTLTLIGIIGYLLVLSWRLTIVSIVSVPVFLFVTQYFAQRMKVVWGRIQRKYADLNQIAQETLANIKIVKAYAKEDVAVAQFAAISKKNLESHTKEVRFKSLMEPSIAYLHFLIVVVVVWFGGFQVVKGYLTIPELMAYFTGVLLLTDPVRLLSSVYAQVYESFASSDRLFQMMDEPIVVQESTHPVTLQSVRGEVVFDHVGFHYDADRAEVLSDINLRVEPGQMIAFVGLSGSGKTTLANLLLRFYDPTGGRICIDGHDLRELAVASYRKHIGFVPQETALFRGTILDNIRYSDPSATEDEVKRAAEMANAWEFIDRLPGKLRARIGDRGQQLSGGQMQRLALARAVLINPEILILDEATSALDSKSEQLVQAAIEALMKGRTSFVIAHRLSTVRHADKIVVLEHGRIVETGSHAELMAKNGHYAKMHDLQFRQAAPEPENLNVEEANIETKKEIF
ncbi:MAG: ABC transporter ATP-binding protein [Candidatus Margulisiibacteriota bacterium]